MSVNDSSDIHGRRTFSVPSILPSSLERITQADHHNSTPNIIVKKADTLAKIRRGLSFSGEVNPLNNKVSELSEVNINEVPIPKTESISLAHLAVDVKYVTQSLQRVNPFQRRKGRNLEVIGVLEIPAGGESIFRQMNFHELFLEVIKSGRELDKDCLTDNMGVDNHASGIR